MFIVRLATAADAGEILRILRESFDQVLLPYTIWTTEGSSAYLRDLLAFNASTTAVIYTVAQVDGEVVGFTEFRRGHRHLFLNHIHIQTSCRGNGMGRRLLLESLGLVSTGEPFRIELDVIETNEPAYRWYRSLGFKFVEGRIWAEIDGWPGACDDSQLAFFDGMAPANCLQARYGFSQFFVQTSAGSVSVGRIGEELYRITAATMLRDGAGLRLLYHLDPVRRLFCLVPTVDYEREVSVSNRVLGQSHRLAVDGTYVLSMLRKE
jgi:ribosomal protein S18 acetylase RimI-like enzyme